MSPPNNIAEGNKSPRKVIPTARGTTLERSTTDDSNIENTTESKKSVAPNATVGEFHKKSKLVDSEYNWAALEQAALQSRLPPDRMTTPENVYFPNTRKNCGTFLHIRNRMLHLWLDNPQQKLSFQNALPLIKPPYNSDKLLVFRVHAFLERRGFINFGIFKKSELLPPKKREKVIIIGAGISGLIAAQQLQQFGAEVIIIEARDRVGGRIATSKNKNFTADLGPMAVSGLDGNPIAVISRQLNLQLQKISHKCPLYELDSKRVSQDKVEVIEKELNRLLAAISHISQEWNLNIVQNKPVSLGQALEWIIKLQEKNARLKQIQHLKKILELQEKLKAIYKNMVELKDKMEKAESHKTKMCQSKQHIDVLLGCKKQLLNSPYNKSDVLIEKEKIDEKLKKLEASPPIDEYLSPADRKILDWYFAHIECATGTSLQNLSLQHWVQASSLEFSRNVLIMKNGYSSVPVALAKGLNIKRYTAVTKIIYRDNGVEVLAYNMHTKSQELFKGDVVLSTLPLGLLKQSIANTPAPNRVQFQPPLPDSKATAIERLGCGNVNKVILHFNHSFWDCDTNQFGFVDGPTSNRGMLFHFWHVSRAPVLIALVAGEAADVLESISDAVIIKTCLLVLEKVFNKAVPQPKETIVTRWRADQWSRGCFSYVATGASVHDYHTLSAPLPPPTALPGATPSINMPRLFFAGEHTTRNFPGTVHGALLSGLREAGRIADHLFGCPYSQQRPSNSPPV